jgi:DNA-directed RNA polymerase subunit RPC12/RpoP
MMEEEVKSEPTLVCEECSSEYQVVLLNDDDITDPPLFCPYCGAEVDVSEIMQFDDLDELDFEDE